MRLVDALERHWEIHFRCRYCGTSKTWRRDTMLGRARPLLGATMAQIQNKVPCPRCPDREPVVWMSGVKDPGPLAERLRHELVTVLLDEGLNPDAYGYGWRPTGGRR